MNPSLRGSNRLRIRPVIMLLSVLIASPGWANNLSIAQYPLFLTTTVRPNILIIYDNSESMDGTMAGKVIAGDDPVTRGNIARSVIRNTVNAFSGQFNWGLESFEYSGWPGLNVTYGYFLGDAATMNFTNDCIGGLSMSNGGLRCIANPDTSNGMQYVTYDVTGDDPAINDVLYAWDFGPQAFALGDPGTTSYSAYQGHGAVTTWNPGDFYNGLGYWNFTPTDAGFLPSTPPYPRQLYVRRAWGYLNYPSGWGTINEPIKSSSDAAHLARIDALLQPETSNSGSTDIKNAAVFTPLAGSMATAQYYFQGNTPGNPSPIELACQKNFVLLATDGNPTSRFDGSMYALSQQQNTYNGGTGTWSFSQATTDVFDQIRPLRTLAVSGHNYDVQTYVVGLGDSVANPSSIAAMNEMANIGGTSLAYLATDATSLSAAFQSISVDIASKTAAASSVSLNTGSWGTNTNLYQARFSSGDWSGQLIAYAITSDGSLGAQLWDAGQVINGQDWDSQRAVLTYKASAILGSRGVAFRWPADPLAPTATEMDPTQSAVLDADLLGVADGFGAQRLAYLRGRTTNEGAVCGSCTPMFRSRPTSKLGDIIHSGPAYIGAPAFNYPDAIAGASYGVFAAANATRTPTIYVGANDGMLHAFEAITGKETLAYVPGALFRGLSALTTQTHSDSERAMHRYFVDGSPTVGDTYYGGAWHTLLVGAYGGGGQGVYALDITDPTKFRELDAASVVRWEFSDLDDADLGFGFSQPIIVKTNNGRWSVIVGNGYNNTESDGRASSSGHGVLFVLDAETGAVVAKLDTNAGNHGNPNGLSGPVAVDTNGDGIADVVYAGDLDGHLWKFDLTAGAAAAWAVSFGQPLFTTPNNQAITVRPDVTKVSRGGYIVTFGTGRYVDTGDNGTNWAQSFYGILDRGAPVSGVNSLVRQTIAGSAAGDDNNTYRISTHAVGPATADNPITGDNQLSLDDYYQSKKGWYLPLPAQGERAVTEPSIRSGRVVFNTLIPNTDPCGFGGSGWVMEVDVMTGNRYDTPTFDTNSDKEMTAADLVRFHGGSNNTSGRAVASIPAAAGFLRAPAAAGKKPYENKYVNTSAGSITVIGETAGTAGQGRVSWRQLQ